MTYRGIALFAASLLLSTQLVRAQEAPLAPRGLDALAARATLHSDMTFDESMLHAASAIMPDEDGRLSRSCGALRFTTSGSPQRDTILRRWMRCGRSIPGMAGIISWRSRRIHRQSRPRARRRQRAPAPPWQHHRSRSIQRGPMYGCGWIMGISTGWSCWWRIHEPSMSS